MAITDINQLDHSKAYNFKDYLSWKISERLELLKGYIHLMSPAPSSGHQVVSTNIFQEFAIFFNKKPCKVFSAPFDVYLPTVSGKGQTVLQPDLCIICDSVKIEKKGCVGSPDLIVEILSPGNSRKEVKDKFEIYQEAELKEYWVVYPAEQVLQVYILENKIFKALPPFTPGDIYQSITLPGFEIEVEKIFEGTEGLI